MVHRQHSELEEQLSNHFVALENTVALYNERYLHTVQKRSAPESKVVDLDEFTTNITRKVDTLLGAKGPDIQVKRIGEDLFTHGELCYHVGHSTLLTALGIQRMQESGNDSLAPLAVLLGAIHLPFAIWQRVRARQNEYNEYETRDDLLIVKYGTPRAVAAQQLTSQYAYVALRSGQLPPNELYRTAFRKHITHEVSQQLAAEEENQAYLRHPTQAIAIDLRNAYLYIGKLFGHTIQYDLQLRHIDDIRSMKTIGYRRAMASAAVAIARTEFCEAGKNIFSAYAQNKLILHSAEKEGPLYMRTFTLTPVTN